MSTVDPAALYSASMSIEALQSEKSQLVAASTELEDISIVLAPQGHALGLFSGGMQLVFGEPWSWKWALPCIKGGQGDPMRPQFCNSSVCRDWDSFAEKIE